MTERKHFNVTGLCIPEKHYMADISRNIQIITETLIDRGMYFTMNRARQYGKTTTLYLLERELRKKYIVVSLSFEAADDLFESSYTLAAGLVRRIVRSLSRSQIEEGVLEAWNRPVSREFPLDDFSDRITELCSACQKGIVLMIDEVDKNSDNQIFLSFLGLLRTKYLDRQKEQDQTFQSVILAGVYDIKNLKLKLHPEQEAKYNSPWNIAADFNIQMSLSETGIQGMLEEYEKDCHTGMDSALTARKLCEYTSGYPYLVSRLCQIMDEKAERALDAAGRRAAWSEKGILDAVNILLKEPNMLFDDIRKKVTDYPELSEMLQEMLFVGKDIPYNPDNYAIDIATMFGFVREENGKLAVANRIFETRLYNYFLSQKLLGSKTYEASLQVKNQFVQNGILNMEMVLKKFTEHFTDIYGSSRQRFVEEQGRQLFLLYLKPIINGIGNYYIESRTRSMGRTDVVVDYLGKQYVVEMKIWHGNEYNQRGEQQLLGYLEDYHLKEGYLLSFCFNKNKPTGVRKLSFGDRTLIEAVV